MKALRFIIICITCAIPVLCISETIIDNPGNIYESAQALSTTPTHIFITYTNNASQAGTGLKLENLPVTIQNRCNYSPLNAQEYQQSQERSINEKNNSLAETQIRQSIIIPDILQPTTPTTPSKQTQNQYTKAISRTPNIFGETETILKNQQGQTTGKNITRKSNIFGETETVIKDKQGRRIGKAISSKPDIFGKTETIIKDEHGKLTGRSTTSKPDIFGKTETIIKDVRGQRIGKAETTKPNIFGETETIIKDKNGKRIGKAVTSKPDIFGKTETKMKHGW